MMAPELRDWTRGDAGLVFYHCQRCATAFYFARGFCPSCGSRDVVGRQSAGGGVVLARTAVHRAPQELLRSHLPYTLVLVQMDEGNLVMGHGDSALCINAPVRATFVAFANLPNIPFFVAQGNTA